MLRLIKIILDNWGHTRYDVKVHMSVPRGFDQKCCSTFYIMPYNKFQQEIAYEPICDVESKRYGTFFRKSEPLTISNVLPRQLFAPGDCVPFTLEVDNQSTVSVDYATVKLIEKITFRASKPRERVAHRKHIIWQCEFRNSLKGEKLVLPLQRKTFLTDLFVDPTFEYKCFDGSEIMRVEYLVRSRAHVFGFRNDIENSTLVKIGNKVL